MTAPVAAARHAAKWLSWGLDLVRRPPSGIVVLIYHRVGAGTDIEVDIPTSQFDDQLALLADTCDVLSLEQALARLQAPPSGAGADPTRPEVVLTFDDGTDDFVETAMPRLVERNLPATLYVATDFVEREVPFWGAGRPLTWPALNDALGSGLLDLGSHTHTHALLDHLAPDAVAAELDRSIALIEERTGRRAVDFAYPKALPPSPSAARAVRERFRSAALGGTRANQHGATDPHHLLRSPVQRSDGSRWFRSKTHGGMGLEDDIRRWLQRRERRGAAE